MYENEQSGKPVVKYLQIYKNGDSTFRPVSFVYDSSKYTNLDDVLDDINTFAAPISNTRIAQLFNTDGRRVLDKDSLERSADTGFVAAVPGPFEDVPGGYEAIGETVQNDLLRQRSLQRLPVEDNLEDRNQPPSPDTGSYEIVRRSSYSQRPPRPQTRNRSISRLEDAVLNGDITYREMNKQIYGDVTRLPGDRIHDRVDIGTVLRLNLYRNADPHFRPKLFVYRSKIHKTWDHLLEDIGHYVTTVKGDSIRHMYTLGGREIFATEDLRDRKGYVVSGAEGYVEIPGGYESSGRTDLQYQRDRVGTARTPRPRTAARPPGQRLHERNIPQPTFFFVFKNGDGLEAKRFIFTPPQMNKGMSWLLEQVGKKFGIYAKKLVTMDNRDVLNVKALRNRGAYIVIPFGESYTDSWYYLPEIAIDTSAPADQFLAQQTRNDLNRGRSTSVPTSQGRAQQRNRYSSNYYYNEANSARIEDEQDYRRHRARHRSYYEDEPPKTSRYSEPPKRVVRSPPEKQTYADNSVERRSTKTISEPRRSPSIDPEINNNNNTEISLEPEVLNPT